MKSKALVSASIELEIPFHDVDVMHVAWHGHYSKYFELARCKLLDKINYNYPQMEASGYMWPVIDLNIRYVQSARFQQIVRVTASIVEWENRLRIRYLIEDASSGQRLTKGHTDMVAVEIESREMLLASPAILAEKLGLTDT